MKKKNIYILIIFVFSLGSTLFANNTILNNITHKNDELISAISVFAGNDTSICYNTYLDFSELGAYINGDVSNGIWISYGDGTFTPNNTATELFSVATGYTLGSNDIINGTVTLILVSDDPDGIGPETEVSDLLVVTLFEQPAMACVGNITLSLNSNCTQTLQPGMLLTNPSDPLDYYTVDSYDVNGDLVVDNILTDEHIGQVISFIVGHACGEVTCEGTVTILDKHIPSLLCDDVFIKCDASSLVGDIGLPIPPTASIVSQSGNNYIVTDFDPCSNVSMSFTESVQNYSCSDPYSQLISRVWQAIDDSGNTIDCTQEIYIERITIVDVVLPIHFDGVMYPGLACNELIDTLENGAPSTDVTGTPNVGNCTDMDVVFTDYIIPECGSSFKVIRKWFIFDNCTSESTDFNQLIKIVDTIAPILECPNDTLIVSSNPYTCVTNVEIPIIEYDDCSLASLSISYLTNYTADTIPVNELFYSDNFVNQGDTSYFINLLPVGKTWLKYMMTDECGNVSHCLRLLQIIDDVPPYVACDGFTSVNISTDGQARLYAMSLDDESWDNCSEVSFRARKMVDTCDSGGLEFNEYVDFCCEEIGMVIMVELEVSDQYGNTNTCMVEVNVNDKLAPTIVAPSDITISCTNLYDPEYLSNFGIVVSDIDDVNNIIVYDDINSGVVGIDGLAQDNCEVTISDTVSFDIECMQGTITRTFIATDGGGLTSSDVQVITIVNPDPFDEDDITWPENKTFEGCTEMEVDTSDSPMFMNIICGEVSASHDDEIFEIVEDACVKILRHWTVVDWCQFNNNNATGIWTYTQVIKVFNNVAPEILSSCIDTSYCLYEEGCGDGSISFSIEAMDDCTSVEDLNVQWVVTDELEQIVVSGSGSTAMMDIGLGVYSISWDVEDLCGNSSNCKYMFDVKDCKLPTPYCKGEVVSTLMNINHEVEIWASDFDLGSFDNCTDSEDLLFSFSEDIEDTYRVIGCDDILNGIAQNIELEMWVTDTFGNQDFCIVNFLVQDNGDYCEDDVPTGAIGGKVTSVNGQGVSNVIIDVECLIDEYSSELLTGIDGSFIDAGLLEDVSHTVRPFMDEDYIKDVTTLDLLLIQSHILNIKKFNSPYKYIAADINNSGSINAVDIIHLRKLLLGKYKKFPKNDSWRFIDKNFVFKEGESPWFFPDTIQYSKLNEEYLNADFIGVKIGDVNSLYNSYNELAKSERNIIEIDQKLITLSNGDVSCSMGLSEAIDDVEDFDGYQLEVEFDVNLYEFVGIGSSGLNTDHDNYNLDNVDEGIIRFLYIGSSDVSTNKVLSELVFRSKIVTNTTLLNLALSARYRNELYINGLPGKVYLKESTMASIVDEDNGVEINVYPNPFNDFTVISWDDKGDFEYFNIYNIQGDLIYSDLIESVSEIVIKEDIMTEAGTYVLLLKGENKTIVKKLIKL